MKYKARLYTGPALVQFTAQRMRAAGVEVLVEGADAVWFGIEAGESAAVGRNLVAAMARSLGPETPDGPLYSWMSRVTAVKQFTSCCSFAATEEQ